MKQEELEEEEGVPSGCSSFSTSTVKSIMLVWNHENNFSSSKRLFQE